MLKCILGGCGTGKSTLLTKDIRQKLTSGAKVIVLVPEQFSFEAEKKLYASLGAAFFNRLHTYSFATLSQEILRSGAAERSYASEQEKLLYLSEAVRYCSEKKELHLLEKRRNATDFILSLYDMVSRIRKAGVSAEQLAELSPALSGHLSDKTHDLGQILLAYDRILREKNRQDNLTDLTEAAASAEIQYFFEDAYVCIDEFDSFTGDQYQMLAVILSQAKEVCCAIRADDPTQRPSGIFAGGNSTFLRLRTMAKEMCSMDTEVHYCKEYMRSKLDDLKAVAVHRHPASAPYLEHIHMLEAAEPVMEVEYICAEICRLLSNNPSLLCSDIAVVVKEPAVYFPLLERAMERYALPYDLSAPKPVLHKALVRHFLTLLELMDGSTWQTDVLLRYVKSPLSGYSMENAAMLEHFCFTWSIDRQDWEKPFFIENNTESDIRTKGFHGKMLEKLRLRIIEEVAALRRACQGKTVRMVCKALYTHLRFVKNKHMKDDTSQETTMLWNLLMDILDTAVSCFGEQVLPLELLRESFLMLLRSSSFSTPPQMLDSIRIVDARTVRLDSPRIVFVLGVREGVFPAEVKPSGMFSQQELRELEDKSISISRLLPELHSDELLIVNKTLAAPTEELYLTYPLTDASYAPAAPAGILLKLLKMFPRNALILQKGADIPLHFYVRTAAAGYFHCVRNMHSNTPQLAALHTLLERDPVYSPRLAKLLSVRKPPAPEVSQATMQLLLGKQVILSPSGIERFANCPFQYFCKDVLHLYIPEQNALDPRSSGNFAHYCLEQLLRSMSREQFLSMSEDALLEQIQKLSGIFSEQSFSDALKRNGRFQFNYRKAGQSMIDLLKHMQQEMADGHFVPVGFEVPVSENGGGFPPLLLRDGQILCHGDIDRVDVCNTDSAKMLRVIDYKTGTKTLSPEKLADGLDMQMLIYLFALQANHAYDRALASGVFYMPSGQPKQKLFQDRSAHTAGRDEILGNFYRMKGLLLDTTLQYMEPEIRSGASPVMHPDSKTGLYSVTEQQMKNLRRHVETKIGETADKLLHGQIAPDPNLRHVDTPCIYCSYRDLCGSAVEKGYQCSKEEKKLAIAKVFDNDGEEEAK